MNALNLEEIKDDILKKKPPPPLPSEKNWIDFSFVSFKDKWKPVQCSPLPEKYWAKYFNPACPVMILITWLHPL